MIKDIKDVVAGTLFTITDIHYAMVDEGLETNCGNIDEVIRRFNESEYEEIVTKVGYNILFNIINDIKEEQKIINKDVSENIYENIADSIEELMGGDE